jgi:hypothetical protein
MVAKAIMTTQDRTSEVNRFRGGRRRCNKTGSRCLFNIENIIVLLWYGVILVSNVLTLVMQLYSLDYHLLQHELFFLYFTR